MQSPSIYATPANIVRTGFDKQVSSRQANDVPKRPDLPPAGAAIVIVVNRMDRSFGSAPLQSGDRDGDAQRLFNFAIDSITHDTGVTVVIDEFENIQIDTWIFDATARTITPAGKSTRAYQLLDGATFDPPNLVDLAGIKSFSSIKDFFSANQNGNSINLQFWRVGEDP